MTNQTTANTVVRGDTTISGLRARLNAEFGAEFTEDQESAIGSMRRLMTAPDAHSQPISSDVVEALLTVLKRRSWSVSVEDFAQAFPHLPEKFGLTEIRETCARLGLKSEIQSARLEEIAQYHLPALIERRGEILVVDRDKNGKLFLTKAGVRQRFGSKEQWVTFDVVVFLEKNEEIDPATEETTFSGLLRRFKTHLTVLFLVSLFINGATLLSSLAVMFIYDTVLPSQAMDTLTMIAVGIGALVVLELWFRNIRANMIAYLASRLDFVICCAVFEKFLKLPYNTIAASSVSAQVASLKQFENFRDIFGGTLSALVLDAPFIVVLLGVLFVVGGPLAFVSVGLIVVFAVIGAFWLPHLRRLSEKTSKSRSAQYRFTLDVLSKLPTVHHFRCEESVLTRFDQIVRESSLAKMRVQSANRMLSTSSTTLVTMIGGLTVIFGAMLVINGSLTVGGLILVTILTWRVLTPIQQGFLMMMRLSDVADTVRRFDRFMKLPEEPVSSGRRSRARLRGNLDMEQVYFRFPGASAPALTNVSLSIRQGDFVSILGKSGSGKSTFVKLILNLYQPQSGTIQLDGVNISQIPASDLRADVGYVQQNPKMFHGTISQNLRLCAPGATDEDIRSVMDALGLYDFIQPLPSGFDTRLNEASQSHLPVGFFQALGLAQAMLRKPQIILLDEPPRASGTELNDVLGRFLESCRGKVTVIMVTSHEQQAELADTVLKLERGILQPLRKQAMAG
ncbi:peptidase domain-containing ABC transporter [Roseibium sediminis]|uniref:peptidase domain-containing ABC transporter n=1 Tax=Roseibium sediminis TaxID=1775174 RepID=UPI00123D0DFC|nr:ATP-binding cassette domain-containing protein [Roseibium sediminis]